MTTSRVLRDWLLPVALVALTVMDPEVSDTAAVGEPVLVLTCLALGVRRTWPAAVAMTTSAVTVGYLLVVQGDLSRQPPLEPFLVLLVAFFALGAHAAPRPFLIGATTSAALVLLVEALSLGQGRPASDVIPSLLFWVAAVVVGRLLYYRQREAASERDRARLAEEDRDLHAKQAAIEERTRIARELHDVVAHSLSVMVVQASVEARLLDDRTGSTVTTLRTIEQTGRDALVELRGLLGLLRTEGESGTPMQPLPSLLHVADLVAQRRSSGLELTLEVTGERDDVPAGIDLSAYRIVQEALTNVARHAPGAAARVHVHYGDDFVAVSVEDDGARTAGPLPAARPGHGLVGMRERVNVYGGELTTGATPRGGFAVRATFPTVPNETDQARDVLETR